MRIGGVGDRGGGRAMDMMMSLGSDEEGEKERREDIGVGGMLDVIGFSLEEGFAELG